MINTRTDAQSIVAHERVGVKRDRSGRSRTLEQSQNTPSRRYRVQGAGRLRFGVRRGTIALLMASTSSQDVALLTRIASLYYLEDATQAEIASLLGFSRPKVARLLKRARADGIVEISIRAHPGLNMPLETELADRFGLSQAILVADQQREGPLRASVARAAAELLMRTVQDRSTVAVGMGRNVAAIAEQVISAPPRKCTFVSAIGGSPQVDSGVNPNEICRQLAERFGGQAEGLYAPAYAASEAGREAFLEHSDVRETLARARSAETAIVGIGDARDDSAVVQMGCFSPAEMARTRKAGAVGDLLGFFFDIDGAPVNDGFGGRVVGLTGEDLRAVPRVIAVTSEVGKSRAVLGSLRTGIVDVLVTSVGLAREALAGDRRPT